MLLYMWLLSLEFTYSVPNSQHSKDMYVGLQQM